MDPDSHSSNLVDLDPHTINADPQYIPDKKEIIVSMNKYLFFFNVTERQTII